MGGSAVTVTNPQDISDPIIAEIEAQTEFLATASSTMGEYLNTIANTPLNCSTTPSAAELAGPAQEPCCRTETLANTPAAGDTTIRETCSDGKITDTITYANGDECTVNVRSADPGSQFVGIDENCNFIATDVASKVCKPRTLGQPFPRYFIPRCSDFGNQIFCVPDSLYAFAWKGIDSTNIKDFLKENASQINLDDPNNQYVAVVGKNPYSCGSTGIESGLDEDGNPYYCFDINQGFIYAHTTGDPSLVIDDAADVNNTIAISVDGDPIICPPLEPRDVLDPLQISQLDRLGVYGDIEIICDAWDGKAPPDSNDGSDDGLLSSISDLILGEIECPDICGLTSQEAYYTLWHDYWCSEKRSKAIQQRIYAAQIPVALAALISSLGTYNDILDKQLELLCDVQEDASLVAQCSAALLGTPEEPGILKQCEAALLEGHNNRIGTINCMGLAACKMADTEFDLYEQLWDPIRREQAPIVANRLNNMIDNGSITSTDTMNWAKGITGCINESILPELKRQFAPLLSSVNCSSTNLNQWREDLKGKTNRITEHYDRIYQTGEAHMIPAIMDMSACMVQKICEMRDLLYASAECDLDLYQQGYRMGESAQAQVAMTTAAALIPKLTESVAWLDRNIPYAMDIFKTCYADEQKTLTPLLWDNARALAPEVVECFNYFKEKGRLSDEFFDNCYRDRECRLVKQQVDFACEMTQFVEASLRRLDEWSQEDRNMFDFEFRGREISALQTVSHRGEKASKDLHEFGRWMDERTKEFHDIYHDFWLPCDIENLKQHCEIWVRGNPLQGIERNNEQMNRLANNLSDVVDTGLVHAKTYLDEVFEQQERFDYCVEAPAYLHVRKQVDRALEELERCTPRWATGHLLDATMKLKAEGARAEGAAYESATRWKWWANEQLDEKDYRRRVEALGLIDAYALRTIDANKTETAGHDLLLNHAREAITRGRAYLDNMQQAAQTTSTIQSTQVDALLRAVQLWHFWPELALQESTAFNQQVARVQQDALRVLEMGHFWPQQADQQSQNAFNIVDRTLSTSIELSRLGQFYLTQAEQMNSQRAAMSTQAGSQGNAFAQTGHTLNRIAADKMGSALQQSVSASQTGLAAGDLGAKHMATALEIENRMTLNALEHIKAGIGTFGVGIDFLQEVRQSNQLSGSYGLDASTAMLNLMKHGQNEGLLALTAQERCFDTQFKMLCKAKDYVQENFEITQRSLHGGASGTLNAANQLLNGQGNNASSAFALLGNSLQGVTQNTTTPPFPTGGAVFGTGGGGTFGF